RHNDESILPLQDMLYDRLLIAFKPLTAKILFQSSRQLTLLYSNTFFHINATALSASLTTKPPALTFLGQRVRACSFRKNKNPELQNNHGRVPALFNHYKYNKNIGVMGITPQSFLCCKKQYFYRNHE